MRLREAARDQTAFAILDAAEAVFAQHGLHAAKMGQIAHAAGIAVGTLYNYFQDRDAILRGLLERRGQELRDRVARACAAPHASFASELGAVAAAFAGSCVEHARFIRIMMQAETSATGPALKRDFMLSIFAEIDQRITAVMDRGVKEGALRAAPPALLARALMALMKAVLVPTSDGERVSADLIVDLFLHGAAPR